MIHWPPTTAAHCCGRHRLRAHAPRHLTHTPLSPATHLAKRCKDRHPHMAWPCGVSFLTMRQRIAAFTRCAYRNRAGMPRRIHGAACLQAPACNRHEGSPRTQKSTPKPGCRKHVACNYERHAGHTAQPQAARACAAPSCGRPRASRKPRRNMPFATRLSVPDSRPQTPVCQRPTTEPTRGAVSQSPPPPPANRALLLAARHTSLAWHRRRSVLCEQCSSRSLHTGTTPTGKTPKGTSSQGWPRQP
jgi:hypothetical protein